MMEENHADSRIAVLESAVSQKIAAGEVIDRPFSVVRELIDNSLDAAGTKVDVYVEGGGIGRIRVVDDGHGMSEEDLSLCYQRYATSKIRQVEDLFRVRTLGFRGEALASVAACAKLEIVSCAPSADHAHRLVVHGGSFASLADSAGKRGTAVDVADLFFNLPARRKFLKSTSSETNACKTAFVDKAVAFPDVAFRLYVDGEMKLFLPASDLAERIRRAYSGPVGEVPFETARTTEDAGLRLEVVGGQPELARRDRRLLQVFVNRRRVSEYSLVQAVQYAYGEYIPGGYFPVAFVFVDIDPELVDVNVHPAKSEVRFRNLPQIHHAVTSVVKGMLAAYRRRPSATGSTVLEQAQRLPGFTEPPLERPPPQRMDRRGFPPDLSPGGTEGAASDPIPAFGQAEPLSGETPRFVAQVFETFLIAIFGDRVMFVDQHAAHERVVFDQLRNRVATLEDLLLPIGFDVTADEETFLGEHLESLAAIGVRVEQVSPGRFEIVSLSAELQSIEQDVVGLLKTGCDSLEHLRDQVLAAAACQLAVKEGEPIDAVTGQSLVEHALSAENSRCPHGRPIWYEVSKRELWRAVRRE